MAKVAFSKLKCKINETEVPVQIGEETIMVKQYLPIQNKLALIGRVIERAHEEDYNFSNPVKCRMINDMEIIFTYTNIAFTEKQKEDLPKIYDMLQSSGILKKLIASVPEEEYNSIQSGVYNTIEALYKYQNSILGLLDTLAEDYSGLELDVNKIQEQLKGVTDLDMIKGLLTNLN